MSNVKCNACGWTGEEEDLAIRTFKNGGGDENICPKCGAFEELENVPNEEEKK